MHVNRHQDHAQDHGLLRAVHRIGHRGDRRARRAHPAHAPVQLRGASEPRRAEPVVHQGPRQGIQGEGEDRALSVRPRLQGAGVFAQPHPASHEAGGLGPGGRSQPGQPRQEQVRAHQLGRGHRHHREGGAAHQGGVRPELDPRPVGRPPSHQDRPRPARHRGLPARPDGPGRDGRGAGQRLLDARGRAGRRADRARQRRRLHHARRATPIPGRAGTGAPSTSGARTRWAKATSATCSWTWRTTPTRCCSGGATSRPRPGDGEGASPAATASSSPTSA